MSAGAVVLDLDDTLFLERDYVRSGFEAVDAFVQDRFGRAGFGQLAWSRFEQGARGTIFDEALAELGLTVDEETVSALVEHYRAHPPRIELLTDALQFLESVREHAADAFLTDGPPTMQRAKAEQLDLALYSTCLVVTDEIGGPEARKPHPAGFRAVEAGLHHPGLDQPGVRPLYVADNPGKDIDGATRAGWNVVRIRRHGSLHEAIPTPVGVPEVRSLHEVDALLDHGSG